MGSEARGCVLHIEDDAAVRSAVRLLMSGEGYPCHSVASGREALQLVRDAGVRPDVLIADFHLDEDMDGAEAAEALIGALGYPLPVIILTADPTNAEAPWTTQAPVWLVRKPMDPALLLAAMPPLVQLARALRAAATSAPSRNVPTAALRR
jgi:CheY-like chemotaxis protein